MSKHYLKTTKLTKEYEPGKGAIDIDIELDKNEIVGFIGPNGAGKTTTMRMIMNLTSPDSGRLSLFGKTVKNENDFLSSVEKIGFLPAEGGLYQNLTPQQMFKYSSDLNKKGGYGKAMELAEELNLEYNKKAKLLSSGNKRKLSIILAMMHPSKLLILDEPTVGLDPLVQMQIVSKLKEYKENGGSVLFSSHVMSEVETVCDRIIMIKEGRIILKEDTKKLLKTARKSIKVDNLAKKHFNILKKMDSVETIVSHNGMVRISAIETKEIIDYFVKNNIYDFWIQRPTLEQMFIDYY